MSAATETETAALERLAGELTERGYEARIRERTGQLPCLDVRNPQASVLTERVYAHAKAFWWSWAERISGCDDVATAASILARVLRTIDE